MGSPAGAGAVATIAPETPDPVGGTAAPDAGGDPASCGASAEAGGTSFNEVAPAVGGPAGGPTPIAGLLRATVVAGAGLVVAGALVTVVRVGAAAGAVVAVVVGETVVGTVVAGQPIGLPNSVRQVVEAHAGAGDTMTAAALSSHAAAAAEIKRRLQRAIVSVVPPGRTFRSGRAGPA